MHIQRQAFRQYFAEYWPLLTMMLVALIAYTMYGLLRHWRFASSGYDLGIFDQAIWHYSRFQTPADTVRGISNLLGDHFHPLLVVLAPFYWIYPHPETLIFLQALLFTVTAIPIFLYARKRVGVLAAYGFAGGYLAFWGVAQAVAFDFHEIALAMPLIATAIYALDEDNMVLCLISLGLLLLVKEDQSLLVIAFGLLMLVYKKWKFALGSILAGILWFFLATKIFIPHFSGSAYAYWSYSELGPNAFAALKTIILHPVGTLKIALHPRVKDSTIYSLFSSVIFLPILSPLFILTIPLLAARFLSTNASYWGRDFHYNATIAPILFMAAVDGLWRLGKYIKKEHIKQSLFIAVGAFILVANIFVLHSTPLVALADKSFYSIPYDDQVGYTALSLIPPHASVTAQDAIVPHLSDRTLIYNISPFRTDVPATDYIIASNRVSPWPEPDQSAVTQYLTQRAGTYDTIFNKDGWVILRKKGL